MQLEKMITEGSNAASAEIDRVSTLEMCRIINDEDKTVPLAVERVLPAIAAAIDVLHTQDSGGGRPIYLGAGTSGRLGILDASECPPTYGVKPGLVVGLIAGGVYAIQHAVEGAEDSREGVVNDLKNIGLTAQEDVVPLIGDAVIVFLNKCRIDEAVLAQCPKLRWVGIIATGTDNLDLKACRRHGVPVANVPGYSTYSVAQMTFSLLLAICQCADRYHRLVQDGQWRTEEPAAYGLLPQVELLGKTFGIYGYGSIGRQTARIAKAFGMEVLVCTRTVRPEYEADGVEFVDLDTLLARSDVLSLHCPATPATRGLINAATLAKAKPGMILLNTARGALVDEQAVADALKNGKLGFYGADAFGTEPLPQASPLRGLPNALLTPHIAWATNEALQRLMDITANNLRTWLDGAGENIVNA